MEKLTEEDIISIFENLREGESDQDRELAFKELLRNN